MKGYVILELEVPDLTHATFPTILRAVEASLTKAEIALVSHVHVGIGDEGLRESVDYLLGGTP